MSIKDGKDYLYLIWKSEKSRKQYIVGQLIKNGQYEFQYYSDVETAINDGFMPLLCFQDLNNIRVINFFRFLQADCQTERERILKKF